MHPCKNKKEEKKKRKEKDSIVQKQIDDRVHGEGKDIAKRDFVSLPSLQQGEMFHLFL